MLIVRYGVKLFHVTQMAEHKKAPAGRFRTTAKGVKLYTPYRSAREKYGELGVTTRSRSSRSSEEYKTYESSKQKAKLYAPEPLKLSARDAMEFRTRDNDLRLNQLLDIRDKRKIALDTHELLELAVLEPKCYDQAEAVQSLYFDYLAQQFRSDVWTMEELKSMRDNALDQLAILARVRRVELSPMILGMMRNVLILASGSVAREERQLGYALKQEDYARIHDQLKSAIRRFCHKPRADM